jgi:hypothetical protein
MYFLRTFPYLSRKRRTAMHLSSETAMNLVEGVAADSERRFWERHIARCSECTVELYDWSSILTWIRRSHLLNTPENVLAPAKKLFNMPRVRRALPSLKRIRTSVIFDSFAPSLLDSSVGRRDATAARSVTSRQLILRAADFDIHIRISPVDGDRHDLLGQILSHVGDGFVKDACLYLRHNEERVGTTKVNDFGEFRFSNIPTGPLSLQIDLPHVTVIGSLQMTAANEDSL